MNRLHYFIFGLVILMTSCDIIDDPVIKQKSVFRSDLYEVPEFDPNTNNNKNVLLEDFTGHICGNCPGATLVAVDIIEEHGEDRVVAVAIHASQLAAPIPAHPNDFRTPYGDLQWTNVTTTTLPNGRIDRAPDETVPYAPGFWAEQVTARLSEPNQVKLQVKTEFVASALHLNVHVESEWVSTFSGKARLQLLITESDIVEYQLNFNGTGNPDYPSPDAYEYHHNHMLRDDVNGLYGNQLNTTNAGDVFVHSYTYKWNGEWDVDNSYVIALITDVDTGEVLNVTHVHAN